MQTDTTENAARKLHEIMSKLWPLLNTDFLMIDIGSTSWRGDDVAGCCICCQRDGGDIDVDEYERSLPAGHPAKGVLDERQLQYILVLDHDFIVSQDGWKTALELALHEFAHAIRTELAAIGLYPEPETLQQAAIVAERQLRERTCDESDRDLMISLRGFVLDDAVGDLGQFLVEWKHFNNEPLFDEWAVHSFQNDLVHETLFYLLAYCLERKAHDRGLFDLAIPVAKSIYVPEDMSEETVPITFSL